MCCQSTKAGALLPWLAMSDAKAIDAGELDDRFEAVTLVDGVWEGQLVEDDTSFGEFPGAFHGERIARP